MNAGVGSPATLELPPNRTTSWHVESRSMATFREKLLELKDKKGWTIEQLADAAGLGYDVVKGYLIKRSNAPKEFAGSGSRLPSLANAIALAKALDQPTTIWDSCTDMVPKKPDQSKKSKKKRKPEGGASS